MSSQSLHQAKIGYLIPQFPGQTHIWMWREIIHLREWGLNIRIYSTRRPPDRDLARHGFAAAALQETTYLWPASIGALIASVMWAVLTRPIRLLQCLGLALTLPIEHQPGRHRHALPLVPLACILARDAHRERISHLHCHTCASGAVIAMMVKRLTGIPYSMTLNANLEVWAGAMQEKLSEAKFTVMITQWLLEQVRRDYPTLPADRAILGRIGVDTCKWVPKCRHLARENVFRIASVSRLHASKGQDILLQAVAKVARTLAGISSESRLAVTIIGDGPERGSLESLTKELRISDFVHFTGSLGEESVIEKLVDSDLFVLASHSEPLGVAYMESMALELPTIGTNAGGVPEIIEDGVNGWLVPPRDPDALADQIIWVMKHAERRREVAIAGRKSIQARFDSRIGAATLHEQFVGTMPELRGSGIRLAEADAHISNC